MFRETFSNRAICVGIILFMLVVGAQLYRWHVRCTTAAVQQRDNKKAPHTAQDAGSPAEFKVFKALQTPPSNPDTQTQSEAAKTLPHSEISECLEAMEAFLHNGSSTYQGGRCCIIRLWSVSSRRIPRISEFEPLGVHRGTL